ncbi:MAG: hypothetical protein LH631_02055 [Alkalinema sp. CAN_BIN05]|nr:hypothetical protein [Alkalinema sp. CAN_BIN05]
MIIKKSKVKQLELSLWNVLRSATEDPAAAELSTIWQALDGALLDLPIVAQLEMSSRAIAEVADIFQVQAGLIFELLDATDTMDGPTMGSDVFDRYVRQSMEIDFDDYIEKLEPLARMPRSDRSTSLDDQFYSQVQSVDKTILIESLHEEITLSDLAVWESVMSVAHGEDVSEWLEIIRSHLLNELLNSDSTIEFQHLLKQVKLQWVELWLGLLLGGYELIRDETCDNFYELRHLWVKL